MIEIASRFSQFADWYMLKFFMVGNLFLRGDLFATMPISRYSTIFTASLITRQNIRQFLSTFDWQDSLIFFNIDREKVAERQLGLVERPWSTERRGISPLFLLYFQCRKRWYFVQKYFKRFYRWIRWFRTFWTPCALLYCFDDIARAVNRYQW